MSAIKLVTSKLSPFGHRVEMCLIEKKISYEKVDVDLANKPDWFVQDSPLGKAPIIYGNGRPLFESIAICEYLEEAFPDIQLHSKDLYTKAWHRGWMEFSNGLISSIFGIAFATDQKTLDEKLDEARKKIKNLEKYLTAEPFFGGGHFSLIDVCFATAFTPAMVIRANYGIEIFDEGGRTDKYIQKLIERESFDKVVPDDYDNVFEDFLARKNSHLLRLGEKS
jgi:glutathione S-transferase